MLPNGKLDSAWGTEESDNLTACGPLIKSGSRLYVPDSRFHAAVVPSDPVSGDCVVSAFDARTGARLWVGSELTGPPGRIYALAASSTRIYVGGSFISKIGDATRYGIAALDAKTGRLLDWRTSPISFITSGLPEVFKLTLAGSRLYVGGRFDSVGGKPQYYLAAFNPSTGALLPWKPSKAVKNTYIPDGILVTHGQLIISVSDDSTAISPRTGRELSWSSSIKGRFRVLAVDGTLLYIRTSLKKPRGSADRAPQDKLSAFDLSTGRFTNWAPDFGVKYVSVSQTVPSRGQVLVLGMFTNEIDE